jgi:N-methylhydantoinase A
MHACSLAEELGMRTILVPRAGGVLSALGLAISDERRDFSAPLLSGLDELDPARLHEAFEKLEASAREALESPELTRRADLRYRRQAFELTVPAVDAGTLAEAFHQAHERRYGYAMREEPVELVAIRLVATVAVEKPALSEPESQEDSVVARREVNLGEDWMSIDVHARARMGAGSEVAGPALVESDEATCLVRPGWSGKVDEAGTLVLERE